jgi:ADP-heptose:LPS heptosyltransferase
MKKILVIRFSSIGDIVLTSPVVRCVKQQIPGVVIHFLTKNVFHEVIQFNPNIDKRIYLTDKLSTTIKELRKEKYDLIIDLHKSIRSRLITSALRVKTISFDKLNYEKWLMVKFKKNNLPSKHIVDRYFDSLKAINIYNDNKGLEFFTGDVHEPVLPFNNFIAFVIGAKHNTKKLPTDKITEIIKALKRNVILIGGKEDAKDGEIIRNILPEKIFNACGRYSLIQSALVVKNADAVLTHDTGFMHIAAALKKNIISIWGNTIPEFGMYPYMPGAENNFIISEVKNLYCRPCSKLGFPECPEKHFSCMNDQDTTAIAWEANKIAIYQQTKP